MACAYARLFRIQPGPKRPPSADNNSHAAAGSGMVPVVEDGVTTVKEEGVAAYLASELPTSFRVIPEGLMSHRPRNDEISKAPQLPMVGSNGFPSVLTPQDAVSGVKTFDAQSLAGSPKA